MAIKSTKITIPVSAPGVHPSFVIADAAVTVDGKAVVTPAELDSRNDIRGQMEFYAAVAAGTITITGERPELADATDLYVIYDTDGTGASGGGGGGAFTNTAGVIENNALATEFKIDEADLIVNLGDGSTATGINSVVLGPNNSATEVASFAFGNNNSLGAASMALGQGQTSDGANSFIFGDSNATDATGTNNTLVGFDNEGHADSDFAFGKENVINAANGYAFGTENTIDDAGTQENIFVVGRNITAQFENQVLIGAPSVAAAGEESNGIEFFMSDFPTPVATFGGDVTDGGALTFAENVIINLGNGADETLGNFNNSGDFWFSSNDNLFHMNDGTDNPINQYNGAHISTNFGPNITSTTLDAFGVGTVIVGVDGPTAAATQSLVIIGNVSGFKSATGDLEIELFDQTEANQIATITISSATEVSRRFVRSIQLDAGQSRTIQMRIRSTVNGDTVNVTVADLFLIFADANTTGTIA